MVSLVAYTKSQQGVYLFIDLGLVDFDLSVQPKPLLPNSHQLRQSWADSGTIKIKVNQTKSTTRLEAL